MEIYFFYLCMVNPKRKWALLESNSPAIRFMTVKTPEKAFPKEGSFHFVVSCIHRLHGSKNLNARISHTLNERKIYKNNLLSADPLQRPGCNASFIFYKMWAAVSLGSRFLGSELQGCGSSLTFDGVFIEFCFIWQLNRHRVDCFLIQIWFCWLIFLRSL